MPLHSNIYERPSSERVQNHGQNHPFCERMCEVAITRFNLGGILLHGVFFVYGPNRPKSLASCVFPEEQDVLLLLGIYPKPPGRTSPGHTSWCSRHCSRLEIVYPCGTASRSSFCSSLACSSRLVQARPVHPPPCPRSVGSILKQRSPPMSGSGKFMDHCLPLPPNALALSSGTSDRVGSCSLKRGCAMAMPN